MPADLASAPVPVADVRPASGSGGHRRDTRRAVLAALLLAAVFTLFCVQWSFAHGRLSQDAQVDDSSYMFEAAQRLLVLYDHGLLAYLANLCRDAPHAPFTDLGAQLAFGLFGLHDWVPYVCVNGPVVFLLLLAVAYVGRALGLRARVAMMVFTLTIPLVVMGLHEFRPDFPGALFTALGIYLVTEAALYRTGPWREKQWLAGGVFFGLALVTKSVFFVHTLTMEALSVASAGGLTWWFAPTPDARRGWPGRFAGIAVRVVLPSLLIAAPYFIVNYRETFGYFYDFALGSKSHVSELKGGLAGSAHFYTFGYAGQLMFGGSFYVGLALYALCMAYVAGSRNGKELLFQGVLSGCAAVSLASIIVNHRENHYFGVPCDLLLLFMLLRAVAAAWQGGCVTRPRAGCGLALLGSLAVLNFGLINPDMIWPYSVPPLNYLIQRDRGLNQRILNDIWQEFGARAALVPAVPPTVFVTRSGFITTPTFRWLAIKAGLPINFTDVWTDTNPETYRQLLQAATFVVAPEDNAAGVYNQNGPYELRFEVERMMAALPGLRLLHRYPDSPGGQNYRLYVNDDKMLEDFGDFGDFQAQEGFLPWEGPYPQWKMGRVRWAVGPQTRFNVPVGATGDAVLRFNVRADQPVRATLQLAGETVLKIDTPPRPFQAFAVPVHLRAGDNLFVLTYDNDLARSPDGFQRALLFRQLDIVAADGKMGRAP